MFARVSFKGLAKSPMFAYAADTAFFKKSKGVEFKPGLNVLVGPNASGKSTILRMLGATMCATRFGVPQLSQTSISETVQFPNTFSDVRSEKAMRDAIGLSVEHDGQPIMFCDPRTTSGLAGKDFDAVFFKDAEAGAPDGKRRSNGLSVLVRSDAALSTLAGLRPFPKTIEYGMNKKSVNSTWVNAIEIIEKRMQATIPKGQPTILLDEPETNFSLVWQSRLWDFLADPKIADKFQIIVASHSAFALGIEHAHYIETEAGFADEATSSLRHRFGGGRP